MKMFSKVFLAGVDLLTRTYAGMSRSERRRVCAVLALVVASVAIWAISRHSDVGQRPWRKQVSSRGRSKVGQKKPGARILAQASQDKPHQTDMGVAPKVLTTGWLQSVYGDSRVRMSKDGPELIGSTKLRSNPWNPTRHGGSLDGMIVVVDPGHGGEDSGSGFRYAGAGFWEAAYSYKAAYELTQLLRDKGAEVYLTAWSDVMLLPEPPCAAVPIPLPRDARLVSDGAAVRLSTQVLNARIGYADALAKRYGGNCVLFVSLHTDAEKPSLSGAFVCVNPGEPVPLLAQCIASQLEKKNYRRRENGRPRSCIVPMAHKRVLFAGKTPQRVIVEMATATASADGFRVRWKPNRSELLGAICAGIEQYAATRPR